jgi:hypothetical protein
VKSLRDLEARYAEGQRCEVRGGGDVGDHRVGASQPLAPGVDERLVLRRVVVAEVEQDLAQIQRILAGRRPRPDRSALARNLGGALEVGARGKLAQEKAGLVAARLDRRGDRQQSGDVPGSRAQFPGEVDFRHPRIPKRQSPPWGGLLV